MAKDEIILGSSVSERDQFNDDKRWKELLDRTTTFLAFIYFLLVKHFINSFHYQYFD